MSSPRACPLCDGVARVSLAVPAWVFNAPPHVQCQRCGLVFHDQTLLETNRPPLTQDRFNHYTAWKLPTNRARLQWLTRRASIRRGRAVDIGTKDGSAVKVLGDMGWQAIGYDPDQRFHAFAKERYGVEIRPEWFTAEVVGPGTLDLVTAYHVLEHIPDPLPWLSEIREALRPEGYVHIETPNLRLIDGRQIHRAHVVLYTRHTLRQMLEKAGFRVVVISEFGPGGNRTYDELGVVAQRDQPKPIRFSLSRVDRAAARYLARPNPEPLASPVVSVRVYRRVKRRIRCALRRAGHCAGL